MDTFNKFGVGINGRDEIVLTVIGRTIKREDALNLAAWIVAIADRGDDFEVLLRAVRNT